MRIFLVIHGTVQGVGYRAFVKGVAERHSIKGFVRNASDGSVEVLAEGEENSLVKFKKEINIDSSGMQVFKIEESDTRLRDYSGKIYSSFIVSKD